MQALDVLDHALHWETERQNRALQDALEYKKRQRAEGARRDLQYPAAHQGAAVSNTADSGHRAATLTGEWVDQLHRIPEIRSALVPIDQTAEGSEWSRPFSLFKADIEPWLSFMRGYNASRLFLDTSLAAAGTPVEARNESQIDYPVRALLELKRVPIRIIVEPPVQINRQVEYQDLEAELRASRDHIASATLLKMARETHEKQLAKAVEQGRLLGDRLHDALMGEGHVNLIGAWERTHQRKPSIEELHLMLTTGRVRAEQRRPATVRAAPPSIPPQERGIPQPPPAIRKQLSDKQPPDQPMMREPAVARTVDKPAPAGNLISAIVLPDTTTESSSPFTPAGGSKAKVEGHSSHIRKILWYAFHAFVCSAAIVAYMWMVR